MKKLVLLLAVAGLLMGAPLFANSLDVNADAALNGSNFGLEVISSGVFGNPAAAYVADTSPTGETVYRVAFAYKGNDIDMGGPGGGRADGHPVFYGRGPSNGATQNLIQIFIAPRADNDNLDEFIVKVITDDGGNRRAGRVNVNRTSTYTMMLEFVVGDGSDNGTVTFYRNGTQFGNATGVDNDTQTIEDVRFGAPRGTKAGTTGSYYLDDFESFRTLSTP